ncbi:MAG TPA: NapC/NirT family cytochrome c [Bdellovibrionota bacterium]|nr:NapC/NirT family cytochrome c [Bdellovibrionota bacterium]
MKKLPEWAFFVIIVIVPILFSLVTVPVSLNRSKTVQFCNSCHVMTPFVESLKDPEVQALATKHYQHRWVAHAQCATCHTDYDFLGPADAKWRGLRHITAYYLDTKPKQPKLYKPYLNINCLQCHEGTKRFSDNPVHTASLEEIKSNKISCLECHRPIHPEEITHKE